MMMIAFRENIYETNAKITICFLPTPIETYGLHAFELYSRFGPKIFRWSVRDM